MEEYIGIIKAFSGDYAPENYLICQGQELPIRDYEALFTLIGTTYGGNGRESFKLPDLRSRIPLGYGQGPNLSNRSLGQAAGRETVTLATANLPAHTHVTHGLDGGFEVHTPENAFVPKYPNPAAKFYSLKDSTDNLLPMAPEVISSSGGSQAHDNIPPFLVVNYIICYRGIYPTQE